MRTNTKLCDYCHRWISKDPSEQAGYSVMNHEVFPDGRPRFTGESPVLDFCSWACIAEYGKRRYKQIKRNAGAW